MREGFRLPVATVAALLLVGGVTAPAHARPSHPVSGHTPAGGHAAPDGEGGSAAGDTRLRRALVRAFRVAPRAITPGEAARFVLRVSSLRTGLHGRVELRRAGGGRVVRVSLGRVRAGSRVTARWTGTDPLAPGTYRVRLVVVDRYGDRARNAAIARLAHLRVVAPPSPPAPP